MIWIQVDSQNNRSTIRSVGKRRMEKERKKKKNGRKKKRERRKKGEKKKRREGNSIVGVHTDLLDHGGSWPSGNFFET